MIYCVIKNNCSVLELSSLRNAKSYAKVLGARLILAFRLEVSSTLHNMQLTAAFHQRSGCKIFESYTPEQYNRLVSKHLI